MLIDAMAHIVYTCNRKMHARVVEVMYSLLHAWGPKMPQWECKKQDVLKASHDYRILSHILVKSGDDSRGAQQETQTIFLDTRAERSFTFSLWARTDKDIKVEVKLAWDCFSTTMSQVELAKDVKNGEDKLPIESSLKLLRRQGEMAFHVRYQEERRTDNYKWHRSRTWDWRDKGDQNIKNILNHKGWAYFAFVISVTEQQIRGDLKKSQDPTIKLQMKLNDTKGNCNLKILYCIRQTKPLNAHELEMTKATENYEVYKEHAEDDFGGSNYGGQSTIDLHGASATQTGLGSTATGHALTMKSTMLDTATTADFSKSGVASDMTTTKELGKSYTDHTNASEEGSTTQGKVSDKDRNANKASAKSDKNKHQNPFDAAPFEKAQLENFMAIMLPFAAQEGTVHGLLQIAPSEYSPEQRAQVMSSITMPDVFLQHNLVPLLVPMCGGHASEQLTRWSCNTLYLMLLAFARPVPAGLIEEVEAMKAHKNFDGVLQQFLITCQLGEPADNLGGIRVLMDVLWKLFTRRKGYIDADHHLSSLDPEVNAKLHADNFYHVPFLESVLRVLTDLCIGRDNRAVPIVQDLIAKELMITNEAAASRRRPEPECYDNHWSANAITVDTHLTKLKGADGKKSKQDDKFGLKDLFKRKDDFVLLALGTLVFFDPHDHETEEAEGVKIPRVLWMQTRSQPPRFACGQHSDDVTQHVGVSHISLERFLYFAVVNLMAHLCADRHTANAMLLAKHIPESVVKAQLVHQETLLSAGTRFVPPGELLQHALSDPHVEARDLGDISDLAGLSAHTSLLLYGYLGQPPFTDEEKRTTIMKSVYLDGRRADDDDTLFEDAGSALTLNVDSLQGICHMCSWQLASLADLCENMCSFNGKALPKPPTDFTNNMSALVSALSKMMSKIIGLGYFERFRLDLSLSGNLSHDMENVYRIHHLVSMFKQMHKLQRTHKSVTTTLFLAGLTDVCRVINQCCALSVNENMQQFMNGFIEFLPPTVRSKIGNSARLGIKEKANAKNITSFEVEESEHVEKVLADLGKPSLPWEAEEVSVSEASRNLSDFVTVLLDFVSLPDAALAIQAVRLLARLCRRRKDFLEAIDSLELLDMDDAAKFNALEPWVKEADRVIDRINQVEKNLQEDQNFIQREGLENYAQQFDHNDWNEDDLSSKYVDMRDRHERVIEYLDKQQNHQIVVRMASTNLQGEARILNFDFDVKSLQKREVQIGGEEEEKDDEEEDQIAPIFIGAISPAWLPPKEDGDDFKVNRMKPPGEFYGCDELGRLYIRGQLIDDSFGGFQQNCVGVELDYSDVTPKLFLYVDGYRVACIDREMEENLIPCVVLGSLQQLVKLNQGRPRRGKGIVIAQRDTKIDEYALIVDVMYDVLKDNYYIKSQSEAEDHACIYNGWNSCLGTSSMDSKTEYISKLKAFKMPLEPKKQTTWCINVSLTGAFIESAMLVRGAHVAQQKAFNSFYTNTTGLLHRMVATKWAPLTKEDGEHHKIDTGLVAVQVRPEMVYGATQIYVCFNEEDPTQLSPEQDPEITMRLRLTQLYPVRQEKAQLKKLFGHFLSIVKQGDGHLLKYHRVELLALRVLSFLRSSQPLRDSIMSDKTLHHHDSAFDLAVRFLTTFVEKLPMYRELFLRSDVFKFVVKSLGYEDMGISGLLVSIFKNNKDAIQHVTPAFVREMMEVMKENMTARPMVSLDALKVLISMVTVDRDTIDARDNGNIIAMEFLKENTEFRLESPFIAIAREGFLSTKINLKDNRDRIKDYLEALEDRNQQREELLSRGEPKQDSARLASETAADNTNGSRTLGDTMTEGMHEDDPEEEVEEEESDPLTDVQTLELGTQKMFNTSFALASIELMMKCSAFGVNRTVLKHFAREVIKCQRVERVDDGEEEGDDDDKDNESSLFEMARQRYFRHVVYWLASDQEQEIPIVVQDAYLRMVCLMLRPHEIEDILHDRWDAKAQRLRKVPEKPTHIVLLLIQWFTQYLKRFPELHVFSPRISPVVEAIDVRLAFDLSKFFVRDHVMLLLLQVLTAYNEQNTWKRWWTQNFLTEGPPPKEFELGGPADRPPGPEKVQVDFDYMVTNGCFEGQPPKSFEPGAEAMAGGGDEAQEEDETSPDILSQLWAVLFDQSDWCHREWGLDEEMCLLIQQVLALGLCDASDRQRAKELSNKLASAAGIALLEGDHENDEEKENQDEEDEDEGASAAGSRSATSAAGRKSEGEFAEFWKVTATRVGRHAKVTDEDKEAHKYHALPYRAVTGLEDDADEGLASLEPDPVLPRGLRMPDTQKRAQEEENMKDFMYELVELEDSKIAANLRVDVNLWRRQLLTLPTFELQGSDEKTWHVEHALLESLRELNMKLFNEDTVLMELMMEVHITYDARDVKTALGIHPSGKGSNSQTASLTKKSGRRGTDRDKGLLTDFSSNQVFFEVEVNHQHTVFLENLTYASGRKKISLQIIGAKTVTMRTRSLFSLPGITVTIANPRAVVLTSPTNFDADVLHKVIRIGTRRMALANQPGSKLDEDAPEAMESVSDSNKLTRKVIHFLMPRYRNIIVDIIEEQCFGLSKGTFGLDRLAMSRILEAEHQDVVKMINKACSYVMLEHLLVKLDFERGKDWEQQVQQAFPNLMPVFEALNEDSFDEVNDSEVPLILAREPEEERMETLRSWVLRICHVVRTVAFLRQPRLSFEKPSTTKAGKDAEPSEENIFEKLFDDTGEMLLARACCASLLNILQEIFTHQEDIEDKWERWTPAQQNSGHFLRTFVVEKAIFFCPFSVPRDMKKKVRVKLLRFFEDAQVEPTDPLRLVPEMLYHPDVWLRLEALKLSCKLLEDADLSLQGAFRKFDSPTLNLQKALAYQFSDFASRSGTSGDEIQAVDVMLRKIQNLCEGHNSELQAFVGEDLSIEDKDFSTLLAEYLEKNDDDDDDDQDKNVAKGPTNLVEWICTLARETIEQMKADQQWQVSMAGGEECYALLGQLFDTAAEIVQGPTRANQKVLLESEILLDVNQLWLRQRIDEFVFRALLQDNEDLFEPWMRLLRAMRLCEISVLKFLLSLLEEEELNADDPNYREVSEEVVDHKGKTIRRMVEELSPKIVCDKVITHWNLSPEVRDPSFMIAPVQDADNVVENDTAEKIIRTKGELESEDYTIEEQEEHCLEICFLAWALFEGVNQAPEFGQRDLFTGNLERKTVHPLLHTRQQWATSKTKIYDSFNEAINKMHHSKYLHFLFGRVEIIRGQRLQKLFFLVPAAIRSLKGQSLIKDWQESCINSVDRSGPEAKLQDFSESVWDEYIGFVDHQYNLSQKPFPLNASGEVMAISRSIIVYLTIAITAGVALVYDGSYSKEHQMGEYSVHYPKAWYVWVLTVLSVCHLICAILLTLFHVVAYSQWKISTGIDQWKEDNPNSHHRLSGIFGPILMLWFFFQDFGLLGKLGLAGISFLGLHFDFLIYSIHLMYVCAQVETLGKVFEALYITCDQVSGTVILGFCVQYCFLVLGFLTFSKGYGFADMDTSQCSSLIECLIAHLDYGFRSGPVWDGPELTWWKFAFDYLYNLVVILILAAIISGIIIDTFANMRADLQAKNDDQQNNCFVCGINRSQMERKMVKFDHHVFQEHYMWSYARFLKYLKEAKDSDLNGPESFVKAKISIQDYSFYPINRALTLDSDDAEDYSERQLRFKDLEEIRGVVRNCSDSSQQVLQLKREVKTGLKESRDAVGELITRLQQLSGDVHKKVAEAQLQKAAQQSKSDG
eukprot:TRINITY_DN33185_c0_g1_i1.p1 TRINITY_DN33185_c0_g1~~TRINITY_DN33185_c0_g1_i1.p1  ORF type:complete len:3737 (+),score=795.69 TRINITY_DN33185_c0_g1_i1:1026-12236(+)